MSGDSNLEVKTEQRLDRFLGSALPHISKRQLRALADEGRFRVNGKVARKGTRVRSGDVVSVPTALLETTELAAQISLALPVLFEDDHLVAIDKPAGMPSAARSVLDTDTVANFLLARTPASRDLERGQLEAGLVHRLDTATSGVLVAARSEQAYHSLRSQFGDGRARKLYQAVVRGSVEEDRVLQQPIRNRPGDPTRVEVVTEKAPGSRAAKTRFRPIARGKSSTALEIEIDTGVRHQIRIHLASIGHPIVGDDLYGGPNAPRLMLHASAVELEHPAASNIATIRAAVPAEFGRYLEQ